jgi:hypothetical protein
MDGARRARALPAPQCAKGHQWPGFSVACVPPASRDPTRRASRAWIVRTQMEVAVPDESAKPSIVKFDGR